MLIFRREEKAVSWNLCTFVFLYLCNCVFFCTCVFAASQFLTGRREPCGGEAIEYPVSRRWCHPPSFIFHHLVAPRKERCKYKYTKNTNRNRNTMKIKSNQLNIRWAGHWSYPPPHSFIFHHLVAPTQKREVQIQKAETKNAQKIFFIAFPPLYSHILAHQFWAQKGPILPNLVPIPDKLPAGWTPLK